ncbi:hypothetical protein II1_04675, partial [Bacillus cereus MC118]
FDEENNIHTRESRKLEQTESQRRKNIGKPYEGKPHVRFDEGKLKQKRDGKAIPKEI